MFLHLKQNGILAQNLLFLSAGIFQIAFHDFQQESGFFDLLMVEKGHGLFLSSKKGQGAFVTSNKKGRLWCPPKNINHEYY